jgi:hypothetical protein
LTPAPQSVFWQGNTGENDMPEADRPVDDNDVWQPCQHDWQYGVTYANWIAELVCTKCGARDEKDVS